MNEFISFNFTGIQICLVISCFCKEETSAHLFVELIDYKKRWMTNLTVVWIMKWLQCDSLLV